jgi:DNA-binding winged helix-turn-helix (wHTH) protein
MKFDINGLNIDTDAQTISRNGAPEVMQKRLFELLLYFASRPNQLISKDELFKFVWKNRPVEDSVISHAVWQLRLLLADQDRQLLRSLPRRGYTFVPVSEQLPSTSVPIAVGAKEVIATTSVAMDEFVNAPIAHDLSLNSVVLTSPLWPLKTVLQNYVFSAVTMACVALSAFVLFMNAPKKQSANVYADNEWSARYLKSRARDFKLNSAVVTLDAQDSFKIVSGAKTLMGNIESTNLNELLGQNFQNNAARTLRERNTDSLELMLLNYKTSQLFLEMQKRLENDRYGPDSLAFLAYALNETSDKQPAVLIARDLLQSGAQFKNPLALCLAQFVDQDTSRKPISSRTKLCHVAQARNHERSLKFRDVENILRTQINTTPFLAVKSLEMELRMELISGNNSNQLNERLSSLIKTAAKSNDIGWYAKLLEFKGWRYAAMYQLPKSIEIFQSAVALLQENQYQLARRRLLLVVARLKPAISLEEAANVKRELLLSETPTLKLCALIAARKHKIIPPQEEYFKQSLELIKKTDSLTQDHAFRALASDTVRERLPGISLMISEQWNDYKKDYPIQTAILKTGLAQAHLNQGYVNKSLQEFKDASLVLANNKSHSYNCVAGFAALEAKQNSAAIEYFNQCNFESAKSNEVEYCLDFFKYAGLAMADKDYFNQMASHVTKNERKLASGSANCAVGGYILAKAFLEVDKRPESRFFLDRVIAAKILQPEHQNEIEYQYCASYRKDCQEELNRLKTLPFENDFERLRVTSVWLRQDCASAPSGLPAQIALLRERGALDTAEKLSLSCQNIN